MFRLLIVLLALVFVGCTGAATPTTPPDPIAIVTQAAENIRATNSFRMILEQTGAPFFIQTQFGPNVVFRRAQAQYVAPSEMQAQARLLVFGAPTEVDIFSRGENQWFRNNVLTGGEWANQPFAPGFNPEALIAEETGFQAALQALIDLRYVGTTTIETGASVHELEGTARGEDVTALLARLVELTGEVQVKVYVDQATGNPVRFVLIQPGTETAEEPEPTTWTIDIYDFNAPAELDDPEATPEP